jgi:hypothetical protein
LYLDEVDPAAAHRSNSATVIFFLGRFANLISPSVPHYGGSSLRASYLTSQPCSRCGRRLTRPIRSFDSAFLEFSEFAAVSAALPHSGGFDKLNDRTKDLSGERVGFSDIIFTFAYSHIINTQTYEYESHY